MWQPLHSVASEVKVVFDSSQLYSIQGTFNLYSYTHIPPKIPRENINFLKHSPSKKGKIILRIYYSKNTFFETTYNVQDNHVPSSVNNH